MARETEAKHDIYPNLKHGTKLLAKYLTNLSGILPAHSYLAERLKNVMLYTSKNKTCGIPMYIGTIKSQTAFVRYSLLRIEVDQKSHWHFNCRGGTSANSSHAEHILSSRCHNPQSLLRYFWKSSDLMSGICHLYLADILKSHVSSTSCLHHCLHHWDLLWTRGWGHCSETSVISWYRVVWGPAVSTATWKSAHEVRQ